jgi:hypothetical protein
VTFGTANNVATDTTIAHGLGTTPTMVALTPITTTASITQFVYVKSLDATNITVQLSDGTLTDFASVAWIAGR